MCIHDDDFLSACLHKGEKQNKWRMPGVTTKAPFLLLDSAHWVWWVEDFSVQMFVKSKLGALTDEKVKQKSQQQQQTHTYTRNPKINKQVRLIVYFLGINQDKNDWKYQARKGPSVDMSKAIKLPIKQTSNNIRDLIPHFDGFNKKRALPHACFAMSQIRRAPSVDPSAAIHFPLKHHQNSIGQFHLDEFGRKRAFVASVHRKCPL